MKKILFLGAFALIGTFALANETNKKDSDKKEETKSENVEAVGCSSFFEVLTSCENDYSLCNDDYGPNGTRNLEADLIFFENIKC